MTMTLAEYIEKEDAENIEKLARELGIEKEKVKEAYTDINKRLEKNHTVKGFISLVACNATRNYLREKYSKSKVKMQWQPK